MNKMPAFKPKQWIMPAFILLLIFYWLLFTRYVERVNLIEGPPGWWLTATQRFSSLDALTDLVTFAAQYIPLRVLRHFIPIILGWQLIRNSTVALLQNLYDLPDKADAHQLLARLRSGGGGPAIVIKRDTLLEDRRRSSHLRIGGPARVFISGSDVAVTERNGRFQRVLGPGLHNLVAFERIYTVLDLQQHDQEAAQVRLFTQDGIEICSNVSITFRISSGGNPPTTKQPYPFNEEAVRRAAYAQSVTARDIRNWDDLPLRLAIDQLRKAVARKRLDDLVAPNLPGADPHLVLKQEMEHGTRQIVRNYGIEILGARLGPLELPEAITNQRIADWHAPGDKARLPNLATDQAASLRDLERARVKTRITMIKAIANGIRQAQNEMEHNHRQYMTALRLIDALENMARQASPVGNGLDETLSDLRRQLRELRWQLQQDEGQ